MTWQRLSPLASHFESEPPVKTSCVGAETAQYGHSRRTARDVLISRDRQLILRKETALVYCDRTHGMARVDGGSFSHRAPQERTLQLVERAALLSVVNVQRCCYTPTHNFRSRQRARCRNATPRMLASPPGLHWCRPYATYSS
jgi:hypothetical protein